MDSNFINSITAKLKEIEPDILQIKYDTFLNSKVISRRDFDFNNLTNYQMAFLILLNEHQDKLFYKIHQQIDLFLDKQSEWNSVSQTGIELPQDGCSKWALLWQLSSSVREGPMFHICFDGWKIENAYALDGTTNNVKS